MSSNEDKTRDVRAAIEALAFLTEEDIDALIERMSEEELEQFKPTLAAGSGRNCATSSTGHTVRPSVRFPPTPPTPRWSRWTRSRPPPPDPRKPGLHRAGARGPVIAKQERRRRNW